MTDSQSTHPLIFAAGPSSLARLGVEFMNPLAQAWPAPLVFPEALCLGLEPFLDRLARSIVHGARAAFIVFDDAAPPRTIDYTIELLNAARLPAVCVMTNPAPWRQFQKDGIIFESRSQSPAVLAAMLFALSERQSAVFGLAREMDLTRRCEGTIRSEMERLHDELQLAASIQRDFTTSPAPSTRTLDYGVLYRPVNFVSSDVYCLRDLGDGRLAFFVGDAAGHGVPAALLTMVLTHALETTESTDSGSRLLAPAEVLTRLNTRICRHCRGLGWFATAIYGVFDTIRGDLTLSGAGHPPPIVLGGRAMRELSTLGPVLGIADDAHFTQVTDHILHDELLLIYTDGLETTFPAPTDESNQSFRERPHLKYLHELSTAAAGMTGKLAEDSGSLAILGADSLATGDGLAANIAERLARMIDEQHGSLHQADDITALVLRRHNRGQAAQLAA